MKLGTRILLLMLLITVGTAGSLAWVVTWNVTRYETGRADERISEAIGRYVQHLEERQGQVERIVRALVEAPAPRSQLQAADEAQDPAAREQLRQEVLGRTVQMELDGPEGRPAFHVIVNALSEETLVVVAPGGAETGRGGEEEGRRGGEAEEGRQGDKESGGAEENTELEKALLGVKWPVAKVVSGGEKMVMYYVSTPEGLFLAMGVPLHTQLDEAPSHGYFVGFRVDDAWVGRQLLTGMRGVRASAGAPLSAWFVVDGKVVARASSDPGDRRIEDFEASGMTMTGHRVMPSSRSMSAYDTVRFTNAGEKYLGQAFDLSPAGAREGRLVLASSMDQALQPLRSLQRQILLCALAACGVAVVACRVLAVRIARPVQELLAGTRRVGEGKFEQVVAVDRKDEFGVIGEAINSMAAGLKERDKLQVERAKFERDLALARKIQMDILPKHIPACPGYDLAAYALPAEQTGGDIYDLVAVAVAEEEGPDAVVVLLADATGHGVGPAISVTQVRAMLRMGVRLRASIDDVLAQINRQLCADLDGGRFVTAFLGMLDPGRHVVSYRSAGQAPLLHFRAKEKELVWLDSSTLPLGIDEEPIDDGAQRVVMAAGDLMILLTDGFYEFVGRGGEQFGEKRVGEVILRCHPMSAKEILSELLTATKAFAEGAPQLDDMTALVIKRSGVGEGGGGGRPGAAAADGGAVVVETAVVVEEVAVGVS